MKFRLTCDGQPTCGLPPATIAVTRTGGGVIGEINESVYSSQADSGSNFRALECQVPLQPQLKRTWGRHLSR